MDNILRIDPIPFPFDLDDKRFHRVDEETGEEIGEPYSYNDWLNEIRNISGVNEDLLGPEK